MAKAKRKEEGKNPRSRSREKGILFPRCPFSLFPEKASPSPRFHLKKGPGRDVGKTGKLQSPREQRPEHNYREDGGLDSGKCQFHLKKVPAAALCKEG